MSPEKAARFALHTLSAFLILFEIPSVWAQEPPPTVVTRAGVLQGTATPGQQPGNGPKPARNLKEGLEQTAWNADTRGPLLALAPEIVTQKMPERDPETPYRPPQPLGPPANPRGYRLEEIAPFFGRKIVRCGSMTVLAPDEMIVLNVPKTPANPFADLRREEKMTLLLATLTEAQWRMLANPNGLGLNELASREQKDLFLAFLPNPMRVVRMIPLPDGQGERADTPVPGQDPRITLTDAQRQGTRLRMNRQVSMTIPAATGSEPLDGGTTVWNRPPRKTAYFNLVMPNEWQNKTVFGEKIRENVPTRLKTGQIDFDAEGLNARVSLADAKTVGDLMKRISEATRQEIYADKRVADLKIWVNDGNSNVRAGDLLRALAWAVTGTYRKVGTAFVLTYDIVGLAQIRGRIAEWYQPAQWVREKTLREARNSAATVGPLQYMTFAADDPLTLPSDMAQRVEASWKKQDQRNWGEHFRMSELPPTYQTLAKQAIEQHNRYEGSARPLLTDRVAVNISTNMTLIIPGVGEVAANIGFGGPSNLLPPLPPEGKRAEELRTDPVRLPDRMKAGGVLCIAPTTPNEAEKAVSFAAERRLRQVWVMLPLEPSEGKETLAAAIAAGKATKIPVCAVVRLMVTRPSSAGASPGLQDSDRDINIFSETGYQYAARRRAMGLINLSYDPYEHITPTGDWLRPDSPRSRALVQRRVKDVAKTPGLAGLVLVDVAAPGYYSKSQSNIVSGMEPAAEFGYTLERRFAILQNESVDPIDMTSRQFVNMLGLDLSLPFFPDITRPFTVQTAPGVYAQDPTAITPVIKWNQYRYNLSCNFLASVYEAIHSVQPIIPIYLRELQTSNWVGPWDKPDTLPRFADAASVQEFERIARKYPFGPLYYLKVSPNLPEIEAYSGMGSETLTVPQAVSRYVRTTILPEFDSSNSAYGGFFKVGGVVFDVTEYPFDEGLKLIREAVAEQALPDNMADLRGK